MMRSFARIALVAMVALAFAPPASAGERRPDATSVHALVALGCKSVPEEGPRAMDCETDPGYFLCAVFEKLGKPVECSDASTPAIGGTDKLSDTRFLHVDVPRIAAKTPCAIWAYPEDDAIRTAASRRCALQVLRSLHCATTPVDDAGAIAHPGAPTSASCPKQQQKTCGSLQEAGLLGRCSS